MKVLFTNNYGMDRIWTSWKKGEHFGHHLWGVTHLHEHGIEVDILPYEKNVTLNAIGCRLRLGNYLDQQLTILLKSSQYDLIYSGNIGTTFLLSCLRSLGLFQKPIVSVVHQPRQNNSRNKLHFKGHDRLLCLSSSIKNHVELDFGVRQEKLELFEWGADLLFYDKNRSNDNNTTRDNSKFSIVSIGHTGRDYDTLVKAFSEINYPLEIYCSKESATKFSNLPENIQIHYGNYLGKHALSPKQLVVEYERAYALTIPLKSSDTLSGLTSLIDAMAMGKAVVMTRNKHIDINIEKEGIGIWVEPGDVKGWQQGVSYLLTHPQETIEMGNKGRYLCEKKYNIELCSSRLARVLKSVVHGQ